jgi:hypothetical protein
MNTARIVVQTIAVGAGGAFACPGGRPETANRVTGPIAQAWQTRAQLPTLHSIAYGQLASQTGDPLSDALRASTSRHGPPIPATMRN